MLRVWSIPPLTLLTSVAWARTVLQLVPATWAGGHQPRLVVVPYCVVVMKICSPLVIWALTGEVATS